MSVSLRRKRSTPTLGAIAPHAQRKAVLYATCFINYNNPGIGAAARAVLARNGKPALAWQRYEESLARGTWDDLSARLRRPAAEQAKQAALTARLDRSAKEWSVSLFVEHPRTPGRTAVTHAAQAEPRNRHSGPAEDGVLHGEFASRRARQGDRETRRQGDRNASSLCLLVSLSPSLLVTLSLPLSPWRVSPPSRETASRRCVQTRSCP